MNFRYKLNCLFGLLLLLAMTQEYKAKAQSYVWALNNGTSLPVRSKTVLLPLADGSAVVSFSGFTFGSGVITSLGGSGTAVNNGFGTFMDTSGNVLTSPGFSPAAQIIYDPANPAVRYLIDRIATSLSSPSTVSRSGWVFDVPFTPSSTFTQNVLSVTKETRSGSTWSASWVRFISNASAIYPVSDNGANEEIRGSSAASRITMEAATVGGVTKLALGFTSSSPLTSEEISVYSNGSTTLGSTNNTSHKVLTTSGATRSSIKPYFVVQFDGPTGKPDFISSISDTLGSYDAVHGPQLKYEPNGKLLVMPYVYTSSTSAAHFVYKNFTDASTVASGSSYLGGWASTTDSAVRYALLCLNSTNGALTGSYSANLSHAVGDNTNFVPAFLEADSTHAYILGTTRKTGNISYTPGGTATLSGTSSGKDMIVVKLRHSGGTVQPESAARYGAAGHDITTPLSVLQSAESEPYRSQTALDVHNQLLYFLFRPASAFSSGGASVAVNTSGVGSSVLKINTSSLAAVDAINLIGTSVSSPAKNTPSYTNITAIGLNPVTKRLMITGNFHQTANVQIDGTTIKALSYYNAVAPFVAQAQDAFFLSIDPGTAAVVPSTYAGAYGRSTNVINAVATKAGGNSLWLGDFFGSYSWDGTALGGTSGTITSEIVTNQSVLMESDLATGTVIRAIQGDQYDGPYGVSMKVSPYDGYIYVLQLARRGGNCKPIGNFAPRIIPSGMSSVGGGYGLLTKVDPTTFNHVWTSVIVYNVYDSALIGATTIKDGFSSSAVPSDIDFDPVSGDVYVAGSGNAHSFSVSDTAISGGSDFFFNYLETLTSDYTDKMSLVSHCPAWNGGALPSTTMRNGFIYKVDKDGVFKGGATFASTSSISEFSPPRIAYLNNKLFVSYATGFSGSSPIVYNRNGFTRASRTVNGTTIVSSAVAMKSYLFAVDANTFADPTAVRNFSALPLNLHRLVTDKNNGTLYAGHVISGNVTLGGVAATHAGGGDIVIHRLDTNTLADVPSGHIRIGGTAAETLSDLKLDNSGRIFYCGSSASPSFTISTTAGNITTNSSAGGDDYLVGCTDPLNSYKPIFGFVSGSSNSELARGMAPGNLGTVFVGGDLKGTATFGSSSITANTSGDFLFGRINYPYQGPGAINSGLDTWFDPGYQYTTSGASLSSLTNKNAPGIPNPSFASLSASGTVAYDTPTVASYGANFYPVFKTSVGNTMIKTSIGSGVFSNSGKTMTFFALVKPSDSSSNFLSWKETTTNSEVKLSPKQVDRVNSGGTSVTLNASTKVPDSRWSLVTMSIDENGTMNYGLNGKLNGTAATTGALNTAAAGTFTVGGGTGTEVAEIATYSTSYPASTNQFRQIATYFALKYGVSLDSSLPYRNSSGVIIYNHGTLGTEKKFANNIAGIIRDTSALLEKRQATPANNGVLSMGAGNTISMSEKGNSVSINEGDYLIFGADTSANYIGSSKVSKMPPGSAFCEGYSIEKTWRVKMRLPYAQRSANLKKIKLMFKLSQAGNTVATNSSPSAASSYRLIVDRNDNGSYTDAVDKMYTASSLSLTSGVDDEVVFDNVEFDTDSSGSDQFALVWRRDGTNAAVYTTVGTSSNLASYCSSDSFRYYRDPLATDKSYVVINPNGNSSYGPTDIRVTKRSAIRFANKYIGAGDNRYAALMPYMINVTDAGTYSVGGGAIVRFFYDANTKTATDTVYKKDSAWVYFPGTVAQLESSFDTNASLPPATYLTPVNEGVTADGLSFVDVKIPKGGTIAHIGYQTTVGIEPCQIYYGADSFFTYSGLHFFAKDVNNTLQLDNIVGNPVTPSPALLATGLNNIQYQPSSNHWYGWNGSNWLQIDNATNVETEPTITYSAADAGRIILNRGHVWGWTGTAWKQLDE